MSVSGSSLAARLLRAAGRARSRSPPDDFMKSTLARLVTILVLVAALASLTACRRSRAVDHRASGDRFFAEKKYREALIEYQVALQADPRAADVRFKVAETYAAVGNHAAAWRE